MDEVTNYKRLGLKAGLEIHQQINSAHKLFCNCSTMMQEKTPITVIRRKQHPVASELGEMDIATQYEYLRNRTFNYQLFNKETCLVDQDDEPPHELNREALEIALQIALLLNCKIPDEIHIMRKTVIDGSAVSGFQRTAVIGLNGFLKYKGKKIDIPNISLEEDAAAIVPDENGKVTYRLNRLGVPLVEIGTGLLVGFSPEEIEDIAFNIGMMCRSTERVKRGIGSIRQDVNVSIKGSERTEIKGVQDLGMLSKIVENEVRRQLSLSELRAELRKRKVREISSKPVNVSGLIQGTKSKILQGIIDNKGNIFAIRLHNFIGLLKKELCPGKTLGREMADYVGSFGIKGIIHSDEDLTKYQAGDDFRKIREFLKAGDMDAIALVGEFKEKGKVSELLIEKINRMIEGPEKEVRGATQDGNSKYTRPLPGAARLYPESDEPSIAIWNETIDRIRKNLPEPWTRKLNRFKKKLKMSEDLAKQILRSDYLDLFEKIVKTKKIDASVVANTFVSIIKDLEKRENLETENLTERHFMDLFEDLSRKIIVKESIPDLLKYLSLKPQESVSDAIGNLNLRAMKLEDLKGIVKEVVEVPNLTFDKAFGIVMSRVRGKADAQVVKKMVRKMFKSS
jgi:glutamyl-tRNA(Gln) amidotransferase subunit E